MNIVVKKHIQQAVWLAEPYDPGHDASHRDAAKPGQYVRSLGDNFSFENDPKGGPLADFCYFFAA